MKKSEITFVVQGGIAGAENCVRSIIRYFPASLIIISTWRGDIPQIECNQLIKNEDPGAPHDTVFQGNNDRPNNTNRQIVSTLAGLKAVKTKYAVKIRSDFELKSDAFFRLYQKNLTEVKSEFRFVKKPILMPHLFCRDPKEFAFHPSDLFHFGLTEDLLRLWDVPLMPDADHTYFKKPWLLQAKYLPEQYLCIAAMKGNKVECDFKQFLRVNFVIENYQDLGLKSKFDNKVFDGCITRSRFLKISGAHPVKVMLKQASEFLFFIRYRKYFSCRKLKKFLGFKTKPLLA